MAHPCPRWNAGDSSPLTATPTLDELMAFDAVLVFSDFGYDDATALGNVMADYVDAGGSESVQTDIA